MISYMTLIVKSFQAKDLPALDEDAANVFSKSERILLDHATKRFKNASELKELIQEVLHHPDFDLDSIDHDLHERLMHAVEEGDIEIIDVWEEGDGDQDVTFVKRKLEKVLRELMADPRWGLIQCRWRSSRTLMALSRSGASESGPFTVSTYDITYDIIYDVTIYLILSSWFQMLA